MKTPFPQHVFPYMRMILFQEDRAVAWLYSTFAFLLVAGMTANVYSTFQLKIVLDAVLATEDPWSEQVQSAAFLFALSFILFHLCFRIHDFVEIRLTPRLRGMVRLKAFEHLFGHSSAFFQDQFSGSVGGKVFSLADSTVITAQFGAFFCLMPLWRFFLISAVFLWTDLLMGAFFVSWYSLYFVVLFFLTRRAAVYSRKVADESARMKGRGVDILSNMSAVRSYVRERYEYRSFAVLQQKELALEADQFRFFAVLWRFQSVAQIVSQFVTFGIAFYALAERVLTPGDFLLVVTFSQTLTMMLWNVGWGLIEINRHLGICGDSLALLSQSHAIPDPRAPAELTVHVEAPAIEFADVTFQYTTGREVLKSLNFTIPVGQRVGLVGYSGAGKSTVVSLLLKERVPLAGAISIFGTNLSDLAGASIRSRITVVPQEPILFHRSLRDNVTYGAREGVTEEEVYSALEAAQCVTFISDLPQGLETIVGERGLKLSGGQRQRIVLARAFLRRSALLVLDEATSSLDSDTEEAVQKALENVLAGRTAVVIAHRLATLRKLDRVLVLHEGELVEDGSIHELIEQQGIFAHLWSRQVSGVLPRAEPKSAA